MLLNSLNYVTNLRKNPTVHDRCGGIIPKKDPHNPEKPPHDSSCGVWEATEQQGVWKCDTIINHKPLGYSQHYGPLLVVDSIMTPSTEGYQNGTSILRTTPLQVFF